MRFVLAGVSILGILGLGLAQASFPAAGGECAACHAEAAQDLGFLIPEHQDCTLCHGASLDSDTHDVTLLVDDERCLDCHRDAGTARSALDVHQDLACAHCHNPHLGQSGSDAFAFPGIALCADSCHDPGDIGLSHPVGGSVPDAFAGGTMTCVSSCHTVHRPAREKMLQAADIDLCQRCHAEKF